MAIPGDRVEEEEEEEEGDIEGASSDGYWTPPDFVPASDLPPPPFVEKTRKRWKTREAFYKGYGVVYLPGDITQINCIYYRHSSSRVVLDALLRFKQLARRVH